MFLVQHRNDIDDVNAGPRLSITVKLFKRETGGKALQQNYHSPTLISDQSKDLRDRNIVYENAVLFLQDGLDYDESLAECLIKLGTIIALNMCSELPLLVTRVPIGGREDF